MHLSDITKWMFLAWVVLFWNLGESVHHLPSVGFDDEQACFEGLHSCSCHGLHHRHNDGGGTADCRIQSDERCSICDFFEQFNLESPKVPESVASEFCYTSIDLSTDVESANPIQPAARGPPRLI